MFFIYSMQITNRRGDKLKRFILIVLHIGVLYLFNMIGTWLKDFLNLSVPGSVIGMLLLFTLLMTNIIKVEWIEAGAQFFVSNLVFFFIPATVGIIDYFDLFKGKGILLILIALISTILVMTTSGLTSQFLAKNKEGVKE